MVFLEWGGGADVNSQTIAPVLLLQSEQYSRKYILRNIVQQLSSLHITKTSAETAAAKMQTTSDNNCIYIYCNFKYKFCKKTLQPSQQLQVLKQLQHLQTNAVVT